MVQVKKAEVRDRIVCAATALFAEHGYGSATINQIAKRGGMAASNVYVYFESKLEIMFAIYEPWFRRQIEELAREVAKLRSPEARVLQIVHRLWRELPADTRSNNIIQAVSAAVPEDRYDPTLLRWTEQKIATMLAAALEPSRVREVDTLRLAHVLMMAFDGFAVNFRTARGIACDDWIVRQMSALILGTRVGKSRGRRSSREAARR
jgi:AcrR family transcriptional regulator